MNTRDHISYFNNTSDLDDNTGCDPTRGNRIWIAPWDKSFARLDRGSAVFYT